MKDLEQDGSFQKKWDHDKQKLHDGIFPAHFFSFCKFIKVEMNSNRTGLILTLGTNIMLTLMLEEITT
jgi:hypothetical protein